MRDRWPIISRIQLLRKSVEGQRIIPEIPNVEHGFGERKIEARKVGIKTCIRRSKVRYSSRRTYSSARLSSPSVSQAAMLEGDDKAYHNHYLARTPILDVFRDSLDRPVLERLRPLPIRYHRYRLILSHLIAASRSFAFAFSALFAAASPRFALLDLLTVGFVFATYFGSVDGARRRPRFYGRGKVGM